MEETILISALSLFAGASLLPAGFLILREKQIPIDRNHTMRGKSVVVMAFVVLCLGSMFLLNTVAQDGQLLIALLLLLVVLPYGLIRFDKR